MIVQLQTDYHLEFLSSKGGCTGSYKSTLVNMPHCWKSHAVAHMIDKVSEYLGYSMVLGVNVFNYVVNDCIATE